MKIFSKINIIGLALLIASFTACDTADQDVAEIISPDYKPTVTVTTNSTGTPKEGNDIVYTITFDKPIDRAVTFTPKIVGGTADIHDDFEIDESVTLAPYTTSAQFTVSLIEEYFIEPSESIDIQIEIESIADKFLVHPNTVFAPIKINFTSFVDPTLLTINFAWDNSKDMDMLVYSDTAAYPATLWGNGGATSANPEIDHSIWLEDPTGNYYVTILDWGEGVNFNYTFTLLHPNGTVQTITGTFNGTTYPYTYFVGPASLGSPEAYKILKVVNSGTGFVVTKL
jgi:hypothetical protein